MASGRRTKTTEDCVFLNAALQNWEDEHEHSSTL